LAGALFVAPYVLPMRDYMPKVEQYMSERLKQPVHIGYLSGQILPTPRLDIGEIYIGEVKQLQIAQAQLHFSVLGLLEEKKPIDSIVMQNVKVSGKGLREASTWLQNLASNDLYPVRRIEITQGTLDAEAFELTGIEGNLLFNSSSQFTSADLRANSGKYTMNITAASADKLQVSVSVRDSAMPMLPNWSFDDLNAKGILDKNELALSEFDARILGGTLKGNASINWRTGWRAQGAFNAQNISMKKLNDLLDGTVDGSASFKMTSADLGGLTDSSTLDGNFTTGKGTINGLDIVETARLRSKEHLPGGRTHFNELSGAVAFSDNIYRFRQARISGEVLNASGELDIEKQQLSGNLNARLSIQEGMAPVNLILGGTTDRPQLRYGR